MEIITGCISPHVNQAQEGHMKLVWHKPSRADDHARVVAWSCDCRSPVYELRHLGGKSYIRKTEYGGDGGKTIYETHRWSCDEAAEIWATVLASQKV
ncbi:hypothetical protein AB0C28_02735 [Nonomuraea sp. NPDC048892]|uniref:hypothetical protein n=1 Tax=Nonomuraea sp. NPDC048892 TaxID=3154624 RepID=UPI0033FDD286